MASIDALLAGAPTDEEKLKAMADNLRREKRAADLFSMSTLSGVADAAKQHGKDIQSSAKRAGGLREARQRDQRRAERDALAEARWQKSFDANEAYRASSLAQARELAQAKLATDALNDDSGGLSAGQLQTGLDRFEKKLAPVQRLLGQVEIIDNQLSPYAKGGEKEGRNIPGVGFLEGDRGALGQAIRYVSGDDALNINSAISAFVSDVLKMKAGTAQTLQETRNVLLGMGQQAITDEKAVLAAWPRIKAALNTDLRRIKAATAPQVIDQFSSAYEGEDGMENPLNYAPRELDFGEDVKRGSGLPTGENYENPSTISGNNDEEAARARLEELRAKAARGQ